MKGSYIYSILFVVLLLAIGIGQAKFIVPGHIMNGDFALYIRQALSIVHSDPHQVMDDMQKMIGLSTYQRYSPVLYPWGYPLLLSPLVYFFGMNYIVFKLFGAVCLLGALMTLYAIFYTQGYRKEALLTVFFTGFNFLYQIHSNVVLSELAYLFFVALTLYTMRRLDPPDGIRVPLDRYLFTGLLLFMCFLIRTEGILLAFTLFVTQIYRLATDKKSAGSEKRKYIYYGLIPYVTAATLFCVFSLFFPAGFIGHTSHLDAVDRTTIQENVSRFLSLPSDLFPFSSPGFFFAFWFFTCMGIYRTFRNCLPETVYLAATTLLLIYWPYHELRYWLSALPFLLFFCISGIFALTQPTDKKWIRVLPYLIVSFFLLVTSTQTIMLARNHATRYEEWNPDVEGKQAQEMIRYIRDHTSPHDIVACGESRTIYLYTGRLSCNLSGEISETVKKADWYVLFKHRGDYLQYNPAAMQVYKRYFQEVFRNADFIIYKIKKHE